MNPKHWISPAKDNPSHGELRIVKLANGRLRAAKWRSYDAWSDERGCYADSQGDGIGSAENPIVAVGAPAVGAPAKPKRTSGPSGQHTVPERKLRVPDDLWERYGAACAERGTNRNAELRQHMEDYCRE